MVGLITSMDRKEIIIVGGGISGLSLAFYCARAGLQTTLLEKEQRVGGAFHSHRLKDGDFWLELGAHTCYNSYGNLLDIIEYCQADGQMIQRQKVPFMMLVDDQIKSIFSQINYPELLLSVPKLIVLNKQQQSVASYYTAVLGKKNYQRVFRHLFNAVPSQSTDDFPADILFKSRARRRDHYRSYTFTGGLETIVDGIVATNKIQILTEQVIESIELLDGGYTIATEDGKQYETAMLALATPAPVSTRLLQSVYPEISQLLSRIPVAKVNSTGVVMQKKFLSLKPVAGIISADDLFYSAVSRDTVTDERYRGFTFHFKPEVLDQQVRLQRISDVLAVTPDQIEQVVWKSNLLPSLKVGHDKLIEEIDTCLERKNLLLTGNYFAGVSIEDCVSRSLQEFSRLTVDGRV